MYQGTYVKKRRKSRTRMNRATVLLMAILMLIGVAAGSTVAYLITETDNVANTFTYGQVSCAIHEDFTDKTHKKDVQVENTGNVNAYIRATYVINWLDKDGNIAASVPSNYTCTVTIHKNNKWVQGSDGYYYYTSPVEPGKMTDFLLDCKVDHPENTEYTLSVEILATAVQSVPERAVQAAWGTDFSIGEDGVLNVPTSN